jgi:hypothetical protein
LAIHPRFGAAGSNLVLIPVRSVEDPGRREVWAAPVASLASIAGSNNADQATWAVDEIVVLEEMGEPVLCIDLAYQGDDVALSRVSYQVHLPAKRFAL